MRTPSEILDEFAEKMNQLAAEPSMMKKTAGLLALQDFIGDIQKEAYNEGVAEGQRNKWQTINN